MSEDSNYCDKLYMAAICSLIQERNDDYGIRFTDMLKQMWFAFYIDDVRIAEIILDMTGCIDADVGEY